MSGIVVMVKAPRPGQVKTRLSPLVSPQEAAALAACFAQDTVNAARKLSERVLVAYSPADGREDMEPLLGDGLRWTAQRGETLGERMRYAAEDATALGFGPLLLLGTDSPTFPPAEARAALALLDTTQVVLGPAEDGGFWCLGLQKPSPALFDGVPWSSPTTFLATLDRADSLGLSVSTVGGWYDIDSPSDLDYLHSDPFLRERAQVTAAFLDERRETSS